MYGSHGKYCGLPIFVVNFVEVLVQEGCMVQTVVPVGGVILELDDQYDIINELIST
jgi:hypothetical protein